MKKLTKQNKQYFRSIVFDMIYRIYHLQSMKKYSVVIKIKSDNTFNDSDNVIDIIIKYQFNNCTSTSVYIYHFRNSTLCNYSQYRVSDNQLIDTLGIDTFTLDKINTIVDNVKEFYKNL